MSVTLQSAQPVFDCLDGTVYVADEAGRLLALGQPRWDAFAGTNGAAELANPARLIGRSLFDFMAGDDVRDLWRRAFALLNTGQLDAVAIPCRCDSPTIERHMRVAMTPLRLADGPTAYLFQAVVLDEHVRPPMNLFAPQGGPVVALCSFCHAVRASELGAWQSAESFYSSGGSSRVSVSHSVCPNCRQTWLRSLGLGG